MKDYPKYLDLPVLDDGKTRFAWHVFGDNDEVGTINWLTPDRVAAAATEVVKGTCISLNLPISEPDPPPTGGSGRRSVPKRTVEEFLGGRTLDDRLDGFWLQGSTQWDGLAHIRHRDVGFYNGFSTDEVLSLESGGHLGVNQWNDRIVGRGVLIDVARYREQMGQPLQRDECFPIDRAVIEEVAAAEGVEIRPGDVLLLRTGWLAAYLAADGEERIRVATAGAMATPGLHVNDETISFLWDNQVAAIAADNPALEVLPPLGAFGHWRLIPLFGFALGELWSLEGLAEDCRADGRYTCMLVSVPLNVPGGIGSPANAVAIK